MSNLNSSISVFRFNIDDRSFNFTNLDFVFFYLHFSPLLQHEAAYAIMRSIELNSGICNIDNPSLLAHFIKLMDPSNRSISERGFLALETIFREIPSVLYQAIKQGVLKSLSAFVNPNESVSNLFYGDNNLF